MKYNEFNKPLQCMMTQSTCYKQTTRIAPKGVLWHSTGANNSTLKRYVQPDDDASNREELIKKIGENKRKNDWNHKKVSKGVNAFIGKTADGTVAAVEVLPQNYRPWGCGSASKGSCNDTHLQFEICEDSLKNKEYFEAVYQEACELTAYWCKLYNIDPMGTIIYNGIEVPTIACHKDAGKLGLGSGHSDVMHWFKKHGKTMEDVRKDVAVLLNGGDISPVKPVDIIYQVWDDTKNAWLPNVTNDNDYAGILKHDICAIYANLSDGECVYKVHTKDGKWLPEVINRKDYAGILNKPIDGFMIKSNNSNATIYYQVHLKGKKWLPYVSGYDQDNSNNGYAGVFGHTIDGIRMYVKMNDKF